MDITGIHRILPSFCRVIFTFFLALALQSCFPYFGYEIRWGLLSMNSIFCTHSQNNCPWIVISSHIVY